MPWELIKTLFLALLEKQLEKCSGLTCNYCHILDPLLYKAGSCSRNVLKKLGRVGTLVLGLPHDTSCKHLADFEEEHG